MKKLNVIFIGLIAIWLTSCVVARKAQYDKLVANVEVQSTKSIAIGVLDHREHVLTNGKPVDFVGYLRSTAGIPYPIGTKSLKPLATDFASSIQETLTTKGFKCSVVTTVPKDAENDIVDKLKTSGSELSILFVLNSWWTDTYMATLLSYDVSVTVCDKNGTRLATKKFAESKKAIGANIWGTEYQKYIPEACKNVLGIIFNDAEIKKALQ
jgi:hypothetical protein